MATTMGQKYPQQTLPSRTNFKGKETRREETTLSRLHIGQTRLTHSFILKEEPPPKCYGGNQYIVKHILIECINFTHIRRKFYIKSIKELFSKIDPSDIVNFLKSIGCRLMCNQFICTNVECFIYCLY